MSVCASGLANVAEFLKWLSELPSGEYVFRGQANTDWFLRPSAGREGTLGIRSQAELNRWKQLVGPVISIKPIAELEWLVLAQHYGVNTPLLDWSYNPLAALYFACDQCGDRPGNVYALPTEGFESHSSVLFIDPFRSDSEPLTLIRADGMNSRSIAQRSVMTLHRPPTLDAWTHEVGPDEHLGLRIEPFQVEQDKKDSIRSALSTLGITKLSLMADITSAVEAFNAGLSTR